MIGYRKTGASAASKGSIAQQEKPESPTCVVIVNGRLISHGDSNNIGLQVRVNEQQTVIQNGNSTQVYTKRTVSVSGVQPTKKKPVLE